MRQKILNFLLKQSITFLAKTLINKFKKAFSMDNIITKTDIEEYVQISVNVKDKELNKYINVSQDLDLKPILGEKFYFDFITQLLASTNPEYTKLFNGGSYSPDGDGYLIEFSGVKEILCYYAANKFTIGNNEQLTRTGYVEKNTAQSQGVDYEKVVKKQAYLLATANQKKKTLIDYIENNISLFPLYQTKKTVDLNTTATKIRAFRKNSYNY